MKKFETSALCKTSPRAFEHLDIEDCEDLLDGLREVVHDDYGMPVSTFMSSSTPSKPADRPSVVKSPPVSDRPPATTWVSDTVADVRDRRNMLGWTHLLFLKGLDQEEKDDILGRTAVHDPEVAKMIEEAKKAHAEEVLFFSYREVGKPTKGINAIIEKILLYINNSASSGTYKNTASAIIGTGSDTLSFGGEIGKYVLQGPLPYCDTLERLLEYPDIADYGNLIEEI
ncbi:uncharacterized protein BT62DRAFT_1000107 [Guyanagaster necrorhizus]|uniref:Uncharacterized protein n=1 Tax=Guyanagaster necrorhizus TaxID=856835 RepID=A0A9P7W563_9AGAR|nr:uncharacterized protein BT62DRAFT_1000107 [Guyanagaster necrorhizus MCA 3950]KAG7452369.1 hypothetical protein BT62DRAFT_1000107 [Guyanagaster necrorhizus MCA 3950]